MICHPAKALPHSFARAIVQVAAIAKNAFTYEKIS
jgi:hypothetical protein